MQGRQGTGDASMIIREKVARAICESEHGAPEPDAEIYVRMKRAKAWEGRIDMATAAINAFLAAAAEPDEETGITWHMRPDEATLAAAPKFEWDK